MRLIIHADDEATALLAVRAAFYAEVSKDNPLCGVQIDRRVYSVKQNKGGSVTVWLASEPLTEEQKESAL